MDNKTISRGQAKKRAHLGNVDSNESQRKKRGRKSDVLGRHTPARQRVLLPMPEANATASADLEEYHQVTVLAQIPLLIPKSQLVGAVENLGQNTTVFHSTADVPATSNDVNVLGQIAVGHRCKNCNQNFINPSVIDQSSTVTQNVVLSSVNRRDCYYAGLTPYTSLGTPVNDNTTARGSHNPERAASIDAQNIAPPLTAFDMTNEYRQNSTVIQNIVSPLSSVDTRNYYYPGFTPYSSNTSEATTIAGNYTSERLPSVSGSSTNEYYPSPCVGPSTFMLQTNISPAFSVVQTPEIPLTPGTRRSPHCANHQREFIELQELAPTIMSPHSPVRPFTKAASGTLQQITRDGEKYISPACSVVQTPENPATPGAWRSTRCASANHQQEFIEPQLELGPTTLSPHSSVCSVAQTTEIPLTPGAWRSPLSPETLSPHSPKPRFTKSADGTLQQITADGQKYISPACSVVQTPEIPATSDALRLSHCASANHQQEFIQVLHPTILSPHSAERPLTSGNLQLITGFTDREQVPTTFYLETFSPKMLHTEPPSTGENLLEKLPDFPTVFNQIPTPSSSVTREILNALPSFTSSNTSSVDLNQGLTILRAMAEGSSFNQDYREAKTITNYATSETVPYQNDTPVSWFLNDINQSHRGETIMNRGPGCSVPRSRVIQPLTEVYTYTNMPNLGENQDFPKSPTPRTRIIRELPQIPGRENDIHYNVQNQNNLTNNVHYNLANNVQLRQSHESNNRTYCAHKSMV